MNETRSLLVSKFKPLVLARQSDGAVVDLLAVHFVQLQFFAPTEVMETPVIIEKSFFTISFLLFFFIGFSYYTYRWQKNFLFFFLVIYELMRRDRFLIHAKWPRLCESCRYRRLTCFFFLSVSRRRTCLFSMPYTSTPCSTVRI